MEHGDKYKGLYRSATARAQWHDYNGGAYFITICTHQHRHYFGEILDGKMRLTQVGECAAPRFYNRSSSRHAQPCPCHHLDLPAA